MKGFCLRLQAQLEMIMSANGLSENVFEIASKSLAAWETYHESILLKDNSTRNYLVTETSSKLSFSAYEFYI